MTIFKHAIIFFLCIFPLISCFDDTSYKSSKPIITCSLPPQAYYIEKIVGTKADIFILLPPFASAEHFEIKPKDLLKLQRSMLWVTLGGLFVFESQWIQKVSSMHNGPQIIDSSAGIHLRRTSHGHGKMNQCDPHMWLSPRLLQIQVKNFYEALINVDSNNKEYYTMNYVSLIHELQMLDEEIKRKLEPLKKRQFLVFHPSWGYFAADYNLEQVSIEVEGKEPGIEHMKQIIDRARKENLKAIFIEPQFSIKQASLIAKEINASVVTIDPLAQEYTKSLRTFVEYLKLYE